jgi:hypothetical protein
MDGNFRSFGITLKIDYCMNIPEFETLGARIGAPKSRGSSHLEIASASGDVF